MIYCSFHSKSKITTWMLCLGLSMLSKRCSMTCSNELHCFIKYWKIRGQSETWAVAVIKKEKLSVSG
ncbi:hypothetical protein HanLR1_Chr14g0513551 [Helianthus annuus]|nr:hypothetical protein HanLR1_Chr14g0513551 [Helianthus annuus]